MRLSHRPEAGAGRRRAGRAAWCGMWARTLAASSFITVMDGLCAAHSLGQTILALARLPRAALPAQRPDARAARRAAGAFEGAAADGALPLGSFAEAIVTRGGVKRAAR